MGGMNGSLSGVIEDLQRLHWAAENRASEAQALYEQARAERDHIARMLKVAGVQMEEPKAKAKPKGKGNTRVKPETRMTVLQAIRRYEGEAMPGVPGSFTVTTLSPSLDLHESSVRTAVNQLREEGLIRAVGKVPDSPRLAPLAYVLVYEEDPPRVG